MGCAICGDDRATYRNRSRMFLCASCHKDTPAKVSRDEFERVYWAGDDSVPAQTKQAFWEDYKYSKYKTVQEYIDATVSYIM